MLQNKKKIHNLQEKFLIKIYLAKDTEISKFNNKTPIFQMGNRSKQIHQRLCKGEKIGISKDVITIYSSFRLPKSYILRPCQPNKQIKHPKH